MVEWDKLLPVPVIIRVYVPTGAGLFTFTVSVELPLPDTVLGKKLALLFEGRPLMLSATLPLNPPVAPTVTE